MPGDGVAWASEGGTRCPPTPMPHLAPSSFQDVRRLARADAGFTVGCLRRPVLCIASAPRLGGAVVMDVLAPVSTPLGPTPHTATVNQSSRSTMGETPKPPPRAGVVAALLAAACALVPSLAYADSAPPEVSGAVELAGPPAALPPRKGAPPVVAPKGDAAKDGKKELP